MQFNPACLSGPPINSTNVSCNSTGQQQQSEFINNIQSYTDTSSTNGWSNPIINSLPLYGIFNSSNLVPVPQDASQSQPQQQNSDANAKKKGSSKRTPPTTVKGDDLSPKIGGEDKSQGLDEEQKLKRQRRLLKNREAAQQFRQRQKEYIQNLERKVGELTGLVGESHKHIELLNTENRLLRDQLVYLYNVMRQNLSLTASPTASPSLNPQPSLITSPIPSMPNPAGMIDLSMLGFKGFDANTSFEEMLKSNPNPAPMQLLVPPPLTPLTSPAMTPNPSPSPSPMVSPMISPRIPDMGNLSLAKGLDMDALMCEGMNNPMFMARYGGYMKTGNNGNNGNNSNNGGGGGGGGGDHNNEPQTVPELIIKAEGGGGNM